MRRICCGLILALSLAAEAKAARGLDEPAAARMLDPDFREVVRQAKGRVFPAVVYIRCVIESREGGERQLQEVSGSGVIISPEGEVLTNWHVIDRATRVRCLLSDGRHFEAEIIGQDKATDLALLKLRVEAGESLPYAEFGDSSSLTEGDFVMAMGAPWGMNRSVSIGIVSCTRRYLETTSEYSLWVQTDASISPGNSGGPLVNTQGQVIGLNTRGSTMAGDMGFAVPSRTIEELLPRLRAEGEVGWAWTGLQLQPLRDFERDMYFDGDRGVIVAATDPESPARRAGLRPRDRILRVGADDVTALTTEDLPAVRRLIGLLPEDEPVLLSVERGGETIQVELTPRKKGAVEGEELDLPRWNMAVKAINQFDNPDLHFFQPEGVFVYGVKYPGNASTAGLSENDIVLEIDGEPVTTLEDVRAVYERTLENVRQKPRLVISVLRNGVTRQLVLDISRDYSKK